MIDDLSLPGFSKVAGSVIINSRSGLSLPILNRGNADSQLAKGQRKIRNGHKVAFRRSVAGSENQKQGFCKLEF